MKFLLLVLAVVALLFLLRGTRRHKGGPPADKTEAARPPAEPESMVTCAHCGIHLPQNEALPGRGGVFCGEPHRGAYEKAHPTP